MYEGRSPRAAFSYTQSVDTLIEPWIGAEELALVLNVSTDWVYEKAALGDLPSYKFGGHRRFRVSEVEDWAPPTREWNDGCDVRVEPKTSV